MPLSRSIVSLFDATLFAKMVHVIGCFHLSQNPTQIEVEAAFVRRDHDPWWIAAFRVDIASFSAHVMSSSCIRAILSFVRVVRIFKTRRFFALFRRIPISSLITDKIGNF